MSCFGQPQAVPVAKSSRLVCEHHRVVADANEAVARRANKTGRIVVESNGSRQVVPNQLLYILEDTMG